MAAAWLVPAQFVANAFVEQYYTLLHHSPGLVHKFYQDNSMLGRPEDDGDMIITSTMEGINAKILSMNYTDFRTVIKTFSAQESYYGGVHVLVTGFLVGKDNYSQSFTQTFFLAPHDKGYYVLNDMFYYVENSTYSSNGSHASSSDAEPLLDQELDSSQVERKDMFKRDLTSTEVTRESKGIPFDNGKVALEEDKLEPVIAADVQSDDSVMDFESISIIEEDPKKSFAVDVKSDDSVVVVEPVSRIVEDPKKSYAANVKSDDSVVLIESIPRTVEDPKKSYAANVKSDDSVALIESIPRTAEDPKKSYAANVKSDDSVVLIESIPRTAEDPKKSYAAIVMDTKESVNLLNPQRQIIKNLVQPSALPSEAQSKLDVVYNGHNKNEEEVTIKGSVGRYSVYVKGLHLNTTTTILEGVFQNFGPIKADGIRIIRNKLQQHGFCFGFVEFEAADAVEKALQASPIIIGGRKVFVEEKRSKHSGAYKGHYAGGKFRDERYKYNNYNRNEYVNNKRGCGDTRMVDNYGRQNQNRNQVFVVRKKSATG